MNLNDIQIKILTYLREHPAGATSSDLADHCHVSLNTARKEVNDIIPVLKENGMALDARPSKGYQLIINDEIACETFFQDLIQQENNPLFEHNTSQSYKVNFIIRRLLTAEDRIPLSQLARMLYYSESSLRRDLKTASAKLADFGLHLSSQRSSGYQIEGSEFAKRLCLIAQHKLYVNLPPERQAEEPYFAEVFGMKDPDLRYARHRLRSALREDSRLTYKLIDYPIIYNYLPLIRSRHAYAANLQLNELQEEILRESGCLKDAADYLDLTRDILPYDDNDTRIFATVLLVFRSVTSLSQLKEEERKRLSSDVKDLLTAIGDQFGFAAPRDPKWQEDVQCVFYTVRNQLIFHIVPDAESTRPCRRLHFFAEDVCLASARFLQEKYHTPVRLQSVLPLYFLILDACHRSASEKAHLKGVIISTYGSAYAGYCRKLILKEYPDFFSQLDVFEYSTISSSLLNRYDLLLSDIRVGMLPKDTSVPYIHMEFMSDDHPRIFLLDHWLNERKLEQKENLYHYRSLASTDLDQAVQEIASDLCPDDPAFLQMLENRLKFGAAQEHEYTLVISACADAAEPGIYFYRLPHEITWHQKPLTQITAAVYRKGSTEGLDIMADVMHTSR
jgi:biotin operon repressor